MVLALMPLARASPANCSFQPSKPAAELPHCAARACGLKPASSTNPRKVAAVNFLLLIIRKSLPTLIRLSSLAQRRPRSNVLGNELQRPVAVLDQAADRASSGPAPRKPGVGTPRYDCRTAMNDAVTPAGLPLCGLARSTDPTRDST